MIQQGHTVHEVVRAFPQTIPVFAQYRIDLCCGGGKTLEEVACRHDFNLPQLLAQLNSAVTEGVHAR